MRVTGMNTSPLRTEPPPLPPCRKQKTRYQDQKTRYQDQKTRYQDPRSPEELTSKD